MPNSIITQDQEGQNLFNAISSFFCTFKVGDLLQKCNARKEKAFPFLQSSSISFAMFIRGGCMGNPQM